MKKNILITTQIVDVHDPLLGFFTKWIREFSKQYERVTVICLKKGIYDLPTNVKVLSLGKEEGKNRWTYMWRFYKYIWQERKRYDVVFVHMNQMYVILGGFFWKILGKKISLWYAHGHIPTSLKVAEKITDICFASTPSGFKLASKKLRLVGQGIDIDFFKPKNESVNSYGIITVGRISSVKRIKESIDIVADLIAENPDKNIIYKIIGVPGLGIQQVYADECKSLVQAKGLEKQILFLGGMDQSEILPELQSSSIFLNISETGSLDKAILEAMSTGLLVVSSNESFAGLVSAVSDRDELAWQIIQSGLENVSEVLQKAIDMPIKMKTQMTEKMRGMVVKDHALPGLISRISGNL